MLFSNVPSKSEECPPQIALERTLLGEITETASHVWIDHIEGCEKCKNRIKVMQSEGEGYMNLEFTQELRSLLAVKDNKETKPNRLSRRSWGILATALPATAVLVALFIVGIQQVRQNEYSEEFKPKGNDVFSFVLKRSEGTEPWDNTPLKPGDIIQPTWTGVHDGYLAIFARTPAGELGILFPERSDLSHFVSRGPSISIGPSLRIEDSVGEYLFWALFSKKTFSIKNVKPYFASNKKLPTEVFSGEITEIKVRVIKIP